VAGARIAAMSEAAIAVSANIEPPLVVIEPTRGWGSLRLADLWEYRELLYFLIWRDLKVRYRQTVLGAAWAILQPLATAAVFTLFFGKLAGMPSDGLPYPLFSFAGLVVWTFFAQGVQQSSASVVGSSHLITKVYFPRLVIPVAAVLTGLVDLAVAMPVLLVMMAAYGHWPGVALLALPLVLVLALAATIGVGLWLSALYVKFRDIRYVVLFLVQLWLFVTPVIYPSSRLLPWLAAHGLPGWLLGLNPMAGVVEGFRWAVLRPPTDPAGILAASAAVAAALCVSGALFFRHVERSFADVV